MGHVWKPTVPLSNSLHEPSTMYRVLGLDRLKASTRAAITGSQVFADVFIASDCPSNRELT